MTRVYYKEAVGAFVVFDITRMSTFDAVQKWKSDIDEKVNFPGGNPIPVVLLANKVNLIKYYISPETGKQKYLKSLRVV